VATGAQRARIPDAGPVALSEDDLKRRILDAAKVHGWQCHHGRPARTARGWRTPVEGDAGFPDLVLARDGVLIVAELKRNDAYPTPQQRAWLAQLGPFGRLWRPRDWAAILAELSTPRRTG